MTAAKNKAASPEHPKTSETKVRDIHPLRPVVTFSDYDGVGVVVGDVRVLTT